MTGRLFQHLVATFLPPPAHYDELLTPLDADAAAVAAQLEALDDGWTVYVRPQLGQDVPDFVVVHDEHGVAVLEVWRGDDAAVASAKRHRAVVRDQFFSLPGDGQDPGVSLQAVVVSAWRSTAELLTATAGSAPATEPNLVLWGSDVLARCQVSLTVPGAPPPPPDSVRRLRRQIVVDGVDRTAVAPVRLSGDARIVAANPKGAAIRGVTGPPGSGKSFALAARAARLAAEGRSVLVLCFNLTLASRLRSLVVARCAESGANPARVTCTSFHTFCARIVDDAAAAGVVPPEPSRGTWPEKIVLKTADVLREGFERRFDAILVDEGQDFRLQWWTLLREEVLRPGGEMLIVTDPSVDLYGASSWTTPSTLETGGFTEPFLEMTHCYRMAPDLVQATSRFASTWIDGDAVVPAVPDDQEAVVGQVAPGHAQWRDVARVADLGTAIGQAVVDLLRDDPGLAPRDVVYLCEYHHDGLAAAAVIEAAGHPVHHLYSRNPDERQPRKSRFWPDADAVKGCTVHAFKGWESPAVVLGIGVEEKSRRLAYTAMTRVTSAAGTPTSHLVVVNADPRMVEFGATFADAAGD